MEQPSHTISALENFERMYVRPMKGKTCIVGSQVYRDKEDRRLRYADVVGIDMLPGPGVDIVQNMEEALPVSQLRAFSHVECLSVLEHSRRPWLLAANIERMLQLGGSLYVTVPFVWAVHGYPDDYWRMTESALRQLFPSIDWVALRYAAVELVGDVKRHHVNGHPFFPRSEICGFGYLK